MIKGKNIVVSSIMYQVSGLSVSLRGNPSTEFTLSEAEVLRVNSVTEAIPKTRLLHPFGVRNDVCKKHRLQIITLGFILFTCFFVTGCYSREQGVARHSDPEREAKGKNLDNEKIPRPAVGGTQNDENGKENKDPYLWDYGNVKEGLIVEHEFVFTNESKVVLNIKDINTSCGCTISEVKQKKLLPGEAAIIGVKFNSKGYSGPVTQYVYMNTDTIDNSIIRYIIKADVGK